MNNAYGRTDVRQMLISYPANDAEVLSILAIIRRSCLDSVTLDFFEDRTVSARCLMRLYKAGYIAPCRLMPGYWSFTDSLFSDHTITY